MIAFRRLVVALGLAAICAETASACTCIGREHLNQRVSESALSKYVLFKGRAVRSDWLDTEVQIGGPSG